MLERFNILLYDRSSSMDEDDKRVVHEERRTRGCHSPTRTALVQRVKKIVYQGTAGARRIKYAGTRDDSDDNVTARKQH